MATGPDIGTGATVTFGGTAVSEVTSISGSIGSRGFADIAHMGTTGARPLLPHLTYTPGELTVEVIFGGEIGVLTNTPTYDEALSWGGSTNPVTAGNLVVAIPKEPGTGNNATFTCNAFATGFEMNVPFEDVVTGTWTYQIAGAVTVT